jgi:ribonuclease-3
MTRAAEIQGVFKDKSLYDLAITHRSWLNENTNSRNHNERLEFLGDAVLEFVVSAFLYQRFPRKEEGFLTAFRSNIVNTKNLAILARSLHLGEQIKLSKGEEQGGGRENESLLADTLEAVVGALYIDSGLKTVEKFIKSSLLSDIEEKLREPLKDAKSRLQELVQAQGFPTPKYKVAGEIGPDHDKEFEVEVSINGKITAKGTGKSKSRAQQAAARAALVKFEAKQYNTSSRA